MDVIVGGGRIAEAIRDIHRCVIIKEKDIGKIIEDLEAIHRNSGIKRIIFTSGFLEKHKTGEFPEECIDKTMQANFFVPIKVTNHMISLDNKINFVYFSSSVAFEKRPGYSVYGAAKTALEIFVGTLKIERPEANVKIVRNSRTDTKLRWNNYKKNSISMRNLLTPEEVAKAVVSFFETPGYLIEIYKRDETIQTEIWE